MKIIIRLMLSWAVIAASVVCVHAELRLPAIFSDHMVLQQFQANRVWGWDAPGTMVTVEFGGHKKTAATGADGRWEVKLEPVPASATPRVLRVAGSSVREIKDVLVGEVWLCGGQSNMRWNLARTWNAEVELASARIAGLRFLSVPTKGLQTPQDDFEGSWATCTPETAADFSAVGFFFGRTLHKILGVPIGLINCSWGGSAAECWIPRDVLEGDARFKSLMNDWKNLEASYDFEEVKRKHAQDMEKWSRTSAAAEKAGGSPPAQPRAPVDRMAGGRRPGNAYCAMLHPIIGYGIKGAIWYQGEANAGRAADYRELLPLVIGQWRKEWGQGDFPFYWAQLPNSNYKPPLPGPGESGWAEIREVQTCTQKMPNTGQAVIIDLGESDDIHPRAKYDVASRLVRWPLVKDYGYHMAFKSPEYKSVEFKGGKAQVTFETHGYALRTVDTKELKGFAICGTDKKWHWADARITGASSVEVFSAQVRDPVAVRYAWADNPVCNLYNIQGLPATPFRSDMPAN